MNFNAFTDDILRNQWNVFGVEIYENGTLTNQWGDTSRIRHPIYSATKTITSIGVGMAMDEGKLDIDRPVLEYLPQTFVSQIDPQQRLSYRPITLKRLLTMSVDGYPFRPKGDSWLLDSLHYPLIQPEMPQFCYSNISAYLVGIAVTCAVEENLADYLDRKLFQPLNISRPPMTFCPDGFFYGASGIELTVNELSRIGLLLYGGGTYRGKRLLSEGYVKAASSVQQRNREGGYGYFLWKYQDGFSINGKWKQKCYILPRKGLVVTYLSRIEDDNSCLKDSMEKHILGL